MRCFWNEAAPHLTGLQAVVTSSPMSWGLQVALGGQSFLAPMHCVLVPGSFSHCKMMGWSPLAVTPRGTCALVSILPVLSVDVGAGGLGVVYSGLLMPI